MLLQKIAAFLLTLLLWSWSLPVWAQFKEYAPPPSYSNAQLQGKDFSGQKLRVAEFSNANLGFTNFENADLAGAVFSASTMTQANLQGANLSNALLDQVNFTRADLRNAILVDAILLRSSFADTQIVGADFTDALLDGVQVQLLCQTASGVNSQTGVSTRESLGCR